MTHLAYVDCSNLFIEGQKVSAVAKGIGEGEGDTRAVVFGNVTDSNAGLWRHAAAAGFEVVTVERGFAGKEKRVDTSLVTRLCRDACRHSDPRRDRITLVAGDGSCAKPPRPFRRWTPTSGSGACLRRGNIPLGMGPPVGQHASA